MVDRAVITALTVIVLCLMACGQTPAQVNNSGHEAYQGGDYAAALEAYHLAQERSPDSGEPYYNSGNVSYRMGEYGDSLQSYDESIRRTSGELRSRGFFNRGNASFQQQQYAQAVQAYKEVLRMNPDDQDAKHNLELALKQIPPDEQDEQEQDEQEQDEQEQEQEQDEQEQDEQEQDEQEQDEQEQEQEQDEQEQDEQEQDEQEQQQEQQQEQEQEQEEEQQQDQPITMEQARQILESVGESAQTLQERRGQVLVSPKPPSEFDW